MERASWSSRGAFILAAVGSAVGLGNAWRFPGLAAKHGGGAFLLLYLVGMVVLGAPLLMMEIGIGRKMRKAAPGSMRGISPKAEWIGWAATTNAFVISCYYAVVFAWVILMVFLSVRFAGFTQIADSAQKMEAARTLWSSAVKTSGTVTGWDHISLPAAGCLIIAWGLIYYCIRNGAHSVSKVVKYTVFLPVLILAVMAVKGLTMAGAMDGIRMLFIPDFSALKHAQIWIDAIGQVFFSLSVMMAIMFPYGSFLDRKANIAVDGLIITFADIGISVLAGIVMFSTMGGTGMLDQISDSGVATAFMIYPQAIVSLSDIGWLNALFGVLFYLCLVTLAVDSAFSIVEGTSSAIADQFRISPKKATVGVCIAAGLLSLLFTTGAGEAYLDIVDNWTNQYNMVAVGILECIAVGYWFQPDKVLKEINRNTKGFRLPRCWFFTTVRLIAPTLLTVLILWNLISLFQSGGIYGGEKGYTLASNLGAGWSVTAAAFLSGWVIRHVTEKNQRLASFRREEKGWDEMED